MLYGCSSRPAVGGTPKDLVKAAKGNVPRLSARQILFGFLSFCLVFYQVLEKVESSLLGHRVKKVKINSRKFEMDLNKRKNHKAIQLKSNKTNKLNILRILKSLYVT